MNEILTINYESENPTVSARELHEKLHIDSNFTTWFKRMCEYGFEEGKDFFPKLEESTGGRPSKEFEIQIDMAKQICMIQRSPEGKQIRQYFIDLEKAWNTNLRISLRFLINVLKKNIIRDWLKVGMSRFTFLQMMRCLITRFTLREAFTAVHYMKLLIG